MVTANVIKSEGTGAPGIISAGYVMYFYFVIRLNIPYSTSSPASVTKVPHFSADRISRVVTKTVFTNSSIIAE